MKTLGVAPSIFQVVYNICNRNHINLQDPGSPCQRMIGVDNLCNVFRFSYHSQKVISYLHKSPQDHRLRLCSVLRVRWGWKTSCLAEDCLRTKDGAAGCCFPERRNAVDRWTKNLTPGSRPTNKEINACMCIHIYIYMYFIHVKSRPWKLDGFKKY